ncbi:hypothetical protein [Nocardia vermiculata]|uniref:Uncharacterized protein n=1 Tax=Nocardia vermiculata TaxID=257274 RepID=A0A846XWH2_9NOCA|nr:hypothetical protein [Nocardia vermiculata]NKY50180.1 hypothetical protein [Nocardia vermiculata]
MCHDTTAQPRALGWVDADRSPDIEQDRAAVARLARRLGYGLVWPDEISALPVSAQLPSIGADTVLMPSLDHLDVAELRRVLEIADVETASPRRSLPRRSTVAGVVR